jgi:hypothetical protein
VLLKLSEEISDCYRHAQMAQERANAASDLAEKADWLFLAQRWLFLAHSYEFSERLSRFTSPRGHKPGTKR